MAWWRAPDQFTDTSQFHPFTEDSSRASSAWSPMLVWSVQFIRWDVTMLKDETIVHLEAFLNCASHCSQSWTGPRAIQPTAVTPSCFSSVLWPLLLDRWPVTLWLWSGHSSKHKVDLCNFWCTYWRLFLIHVDVLNYSASSFPAFCSDSRPASVLQRLVGIYEKQGIRGYYNGMGASFIRAIPCALINYTLTRQFENLFSSMESWTWKEVALFVCWTVSS